MDPTVFFDMSYGVYVVSAYDAENGRSTGCTANAVMQVTAEPETVAVSINHVNRTPALKRRANSPFPSWRKLRSP